MLDYLEVFLPDFFLQLSDIISLFFGSQFFVIIFGVFIISSIVAALIYIFIR